MWYCILVYIICCLLIKNKELSTENKIYYNNFKTALMVLGEYDPKLKKYLESQNQIEKGR